MPSASPLALGKWPTENPLAAYIDTVMQRRNCNMAAHACERTFLADKLETARSGARFMKALLKDTAVTPGINQRSLGGFFSDGRWTK